jgi:hypothetical protein
MFSLAVPGCRSQGSRNEIAPSSVPAFASQKQAPTRIADSGPTFAENRKPPSPAQQEAKGRKSPAPVSDVVDTATRFLGWSDELPILRQADSLSNGSVRTIFQRLNLDGSLATLDASAWHGKEKGAPVKNPPGLSKGKLLVQGHTVLADDPEVTLNINADAQRFDAMQKALQDWKDGKRDASEGFPSVPAVLSIRVSSSGRPPTTLWKDSTTLGVSAGEAGFEYLEPYLSAAVLSVSGKRLYVEITTGEDVERHVLVISENLK